MAFSYGRAGRLTAKNGGFWPGQVPMSAGYSILAIVLLRLLVKGYAKLAGRMMINTSFLPMIQALRTTAMAKVTASSPTEFARHSKTVRAAPGRLSALSIFLCKSILYGAFVWARRALNS